MASGSGSGYRLALGALVLVLACRKSGQADETDAGAGGTTGGSALSGASGTMSGAAGVGGAAGGAGAAGTAAGGADGGGASGTAGAAAGMGGGGGPAGAGGSAAGGGGAAGAGGSAAGAGGGAAGAGGGATGTGGGAGTGGTAPAMTCDGFDIPGDYVPGGRFSYDTTTAGVAVDTVSGLAWQRVVTGNEARWSTATQYCEGLTLGGESGWRVPSALELSSIARFAIAGLLGNNAAIDVDTFPGTPTTYFLTSTGVYMDGRRVGGETTWHTVDFKTGLTLNGTPLSGSVRCVRTATPRRCYPTGGRFTPMPVGSVAAVVDAATGLAWQKGVAPSALTWDDALAYCTALGDGFHLPQAKHLLSLIEWKTTGVAIDLATFPNTPAGSFWSATLISGASDQAVTVDFTRDVYAGTAIVATSTKQYVRCIR